MLLTHPLKERGDLKAPAPCCCSVILATRRSQRSEMGYSLRLLAQCARGDALWALRLILRLLLVRMRSRLMHSLRRSKPFCGSVGVGNPQKVSGAFIDPLAVAVCYAA
jgi:hypothetical protein